MIELEQTPLLKDQILQIRATLDAFDHMTGREKWEHSYIPVTMYTLGKKATMDMRMVNADNPDEPGSKLNRVADEIAALYQKYTPVQGTQFAFADLYQDNPDNPRFNLYEELKRKLVQKGVPEKEIVIADDKFEGARRQAALDAFRNGDIRVLIGNRERIGTGVDAANHAVAAHQIDAPDKPAQYQQSNARVVRQQNQNTEVEIVTYGVKGSLDGARYDRLGGKQAAQDQLMRGNVKGQFVADPFTEDYMDYRAQMAVYSGNPKSMEKIGLETKIREMEALQSGHRSQVLQSRRNIDDLKTRIIPTTEKDLAQAQATAKAFEGAFPKDFEPRIEIGGQTFIGKEDATKALDKYTEAVIKNGLEAARAEKRAGILTTKTRDDLVLNGFPIETRTEVVRNAVYNLESKQTSWDEKAQIDWNFKGVGRHGTFTTGQGLFRGIEPAMEYVQRQPQLVAADLETRLRSVRDLTNFVERPFDRAVELVAAKARLAQVDAELEAEGTKLDLPPSDVFVEDSDEPALGPMPTGKGPAGFPEIRKTPADIPQSITPLERNYQPPAPGQAEKIIRRGDIIRNLQEALQVPIRYGHANYGQMKALGLFKDVEEVVRVKLPNDMETVAHEVGHFISKKFIRPQGGMPRSAVLELIKMGKDLYGNRKPSHGYTEEGIAEAIRFYITQPIELSNKAPDFTGYFNRFLNNQPDLRDTLDRARSDWEQYQNQPAMARILSQISIGETGKPRPITLDKLYAQAIDRYHMVKVFTDRMNQGKPPLSPLDDPYTLLRLFSGWIGKADLFLKDAPIDYDTLRPVPGVKALNDILGPFEKRGELDLLRGYHVALSAVDRINRGQQTGFRPEDLQAVINDYGSRPEFVRAVEEYTAWENAILDYARKGGLFSLEQVEAMQAAHPHHVPFMRFLEHLSDKPQGGTGKKFADVSSPIKRAKGGTAEQIDPYESAVRNLYAIISATDRNDVSRAIVRLAAQTEGMGKFVEKVPRGKIPITITQDEIANILRVLGASETDVSIEDLPEQLVVGFRPNPKIPGMENIISVREDGKPSLYQVHPDLYEPLAGLDRSQMNVLIKLLRMPASWLRLGATTFSPEFAIRNPARDQLTAAIFSQYGYVPGVDLMRGLFHIISNDEMYQAWKAGGGEHSMMVSMDRRALQKTLKDVLKSNQFEGIAKTIIIDPLDSLRALSEFGEAATRVGEFSKAIEKLGGLTKENILKGGFAAREVTLDFDRAGSMMRASGLNQIIAFLNARIQGIDKIARGFKDNPGRTFAKVLAWITLPSLILWLQNHDDPQFYEQPSWQRDNFWLIPSKHMDRATWEKMTDQQKADWSNQHIVWRIPKPFEPGVLFGTSVERALDWIYEHDPKAISHYFDSMIADWSNFVPTSLLPLIENFGNYSQFRGRPIVSRGKEEVSPSQQYNAYTTETAKAIGKVVQYSPSKIENLVRGWFGGVGQIGLEATSPIAGALAAAGKPKPPEPSKTWADVPVVRAFIARFPGQPESVERFYTLLNNAREAKKTYRMMINDRRIQEAKTYFTQNKEAINDAQRLEGFAKSIGQLGKREDAIRESNLSPDRKRRELDIITFRITALARKGLKPEKEPLPAVVNE